MPGKKKIASDPEAIKRGRLQKRVSSKATFPRPGRIKKDVKGKRHVGE